MPPKKADNKSKTDAKGNNGKSKRKIIAKGEGMGGTIGLPMKDEKKCILPCVKSFVRPPACCPQEMRCPMPVCCTPTQACPATSSPGSTACCYMP